MAGPQLAGSFAFRQGTAGDGSAITVVAATDVSVDVTVGGDGARLVDGSGAFVILTGGVAGYLTGKVTIAAGPVGAGADILLRVNTTTGPVDTSVDVGGRTLSVKFTARATSSGLAVEPHADHRRRSSRSRAASPSATPRSAVRRPRCSPATG